VAVSVVIADDNEDIRALVRFTLDLDDRFQVVGEASDGREAIDVCTMLRPDALVLDLQMPVLDGARALPLIVDVSPSTAVLVYTAYYTDEVAAELSASGAARVLTKTARPGDLADVLHEVVTERGAVQEERTTE
jgi:DNA-binding NarL/FixJ family response regulator